MLAKKRSRSATRLASIVTVVLLAAAGCGDDSSTSPPDEVFELTSPVGGEMLVAGTTTEVRWTAPADLTGFEVLLSTDGGVSFESVATAVATSPYLWTLPVDLSDDCLVRVRHPGSSQEITSAAVFRIIELTFSGMIQPILSERCLEGCHSPEVAEARLVLSSWDNFILGSDNGEVFVPFRADQSNMIDHLLGTAAPRMPLSRDPLSPAEIELFVAWIDQGARNDAGDVPFQNSTRKIYVANQGSDEISVIDLDGLVTVRIIEVGSSPNLEGPHNVWIDQPGERWYVTLINTNPGELWQYSTETDEFLGKALVGDSPANGVTTKDGSTIYVTNWDQGQDRLGSVTVVDALTMTVVDTIQVGGRPHGILISPDDTRLYTSNYYTDDISVVDLTLPEPELINAIPVAPDVNPLSPLKYQPNELILSPDERFLFVALFEPNQTEVRVLDLHGDSLFTTIPTGGAAFLEELSPDGTELYVADWGSNTITVIDAVNFTRIAILQDVNFSKPHGVAFSPDGRYAFITNENRDGSAEEHHPTTEGGLPNGNITVIDTATRQVVKTVELEPVSAGIAVLY